MQKLPKSLSVDTLLRQKLPTDMTIKEALAFLMSSDVVAAVKRSVSRPDAVRVRFLYEATGEPLPDDMQLAEFRRLAARGEAVLSIDEGEGGMRVPA